MSDAIDRPEHYQFGQMEAWDIIELAVMDIADPVTAYHTASALKYLLRAARKNGAQDIAKACAHLKRETLRHVTPSPEYDPASVAFRHGEIEQVCGVCEADDVTREHFALNYGFVPGQVTLTAAEIAHREGAADYGAPITPHCATPGDRL